MPCAGAWTGSTTGCSAETLIAWSADSADGRIDTLAARRARTDEPRRHVGRLTTERGSLGLMAVALLALPMGAVGPAAAGGVGASGLVTQAFRATPYVRPALPRTGSRRFYLTGSASDDVNKLTGQPTAT